MEVEKGKIQVKKIASPTSDVPSAPTMDDFYIDPGLGDAAPLASRHCPPHFQTHWELRHAQVILT